MQEGISKNRAPLPQEEVSQKPETPESEKRTPREILSEQIEINQLNNSEFKTTLGALQESTEIPSDQKVKHLLRFQEELDRRTREFSSGLEAHNKSLDAVKQSLGVEGEDYKSTTEDDFLEKMRIVSERTQAVDALLEDTRRDMVKNRENGEVKAQLKSYFEKGVGILQDGMVRFGNALGKRTENGLNEIISESGSQAIRGAFFELQNIAGSKEIPSEDALNQVVQRLSYGIQEIGNGEPSRRFAENTDSLRSLKFSLDAISEGIREFGSGFGMYAENGNTDAYESTRAILQKIVDTNIPNAIDYLSRRFNAVERLRDGY